jgi:hypothetical protein
MKYNILNKILDKISKDAPQEYIKYKLTKNTQTNNQVRAKCIIHLFLMVRFGIQDFKEREKFITEGAHDGGIDAYYTDTVNKIVYIIQSKYRATENNFENDEITINEIIKMDVGRILRGETKDEQGNEYNGKIKGFQRIYSELPEQGLYRRRVIFLCNLSSYQDEQIKRLIDNFEFEIFDHNKTYEKLVFPLLISTYFDPESLDISINLSNKEAPHLKQKITTKLGNFDIIVVFVPTYEIAKVMSKYKNALLMYNPRNYLSLEKNEVNKEIKKSILDFDTGEFAIFNNGITIFADAAGVNTSSGRQDVGTVTIKKPQIINGGQTAFTLSKLFDDQTSKEKFDHKEVMLKIITPSYTTKSANDDIEIITNISKSTNKQSRIEEADMRANDELQIELQKVLFSKYGLFYERKTGEFEESAKKGFVETSHLIRRDDLIKAYLSFKGSPGQAKNAKKDTLFGTNKFYEIYNNLEDAPKICLSIKLFQKITVLEKTHRRNCPDPYGKALKYGKNAMIYMYSLVFEHTIDDNFIDSNIMKMLNNWRNFEQTIISSNQDDSSIFNDYRNHSINEKIRSYSEIMKQNVS